MLKLALLSVALVLQLLVLSTAHAQGIPSNCKRSFVPDASCPYDTSSLGTCSLPNGGAIGEPAENQRQCYRTCMTSPGCDGQCYASLVTDEPITFTPTSSPGATVNVSEATIFSPKYLRGDPYRKSTICRWHISCPPNNLLYYSIIGFDLEPPVNGECLDYLSIITGSQAPVEQCGSQATVSQGETTNRLLVEFQSNRVTNAAGFMMNLVCVGASVSGR